MAFLKIVNKRKNYKLVGASLPLWVHVYMTLYSVAKNTTKSQILKAQMNEWVMTHQKKENEQVLIDLIVKKLYTLWATEQSLNRRKKLTYERFKSKVARELAAKGIPENFISLIINKL